MISESLQCLDSSRIVAVTYSTLVTDPNFEGDGRVGFEDFVQFVGRFGSKKGNSGYDARFDPDGNGITGFSDFLAFAADFGKSSN